VVEHAYPSSLLGWVVIVLRRHAEALHDLWRAEGEELGLLQWAMSRVLASETSCLKEYSVFFAEAPGFQHVHVHLIPRAPDLPPELRGGRIFTFLQVEEGQVVAKDSVVAFCSRASAKVSRLLNN
jgi:diadenosine tetraphosphate (Ap4A) HIT family hydrolase